MDGEVQTLAQPQRLVLAAARAGTTFRRTGYRDRLCRRGDGLRGVLKSAKTLESRMASRTTPTLVVSMLLDTGIRFT